MQALPTRSVDLITWKTGAMHEDSITVLDQGMMQVPMCMPCDQKGGLFET